MLSRLGLELLLFIGLAVLFFVILKKLAGSRWFSKVVTIEIPPETPDEIEHSLDTAEDVARQRANKADVVVEAEKALAARLRKRTRK